jgi:hypothetical protein
MDPDVLVENIVVWYGRQISKTTYEEYLDTYIQITKPEQIPSFIYRLFFEKTKKREFAQKLRELGIQVIR